jgi:hypothetical protein
MFLSSLRQKNTFHVIDAKIGVKSMVDKEAWA